MGIFLSVASAQTEPETNIPPEPEIIMPIQGWIIDEDWLAEYLPDETVELVADMSQEDWKQFWQVIEQALQTESLDDMAWILPEAETALSCLEAIPEGEAYADWLRQRLDYFTAADDVVRRIPGTPPAHLRPSGGFRTGDVIRVNLVPPKLPKPIKIPNTLAERRNQILRSVDYWKKKLAQRPLRPQATELVPRLKAVFREEGIPTELIWIAEVESSFDPRALSPMGAVGLFQFMPATAKRFGLKTDIPDERLIPEKAARAAAQYLRFLHTEYGTWSLTLAAYNAGEGRISRILKQYSAKSYEEISYRLPLQTRMYVPKVMATVSLREKVDLMNLPPPKSGSSPVVRLKPSDPDV